MEGMIFRRARQEELPRILRMQTDVFSGEQGIPCDDIDTFLQKKPLCWCAEQNGKIYAAAAAWYENGQLHWGRFVVFPLMRGRHIGTKLARCCFDDLFLQGAETIYMDARDATVKIVCAMGGETTGKPHSFYKGNVTPVMLQKQNYRIG